MQIKKPLQNEATIDMSKSERVLTQLRAQIIAGTYKPGTRLPTVDQLEGIFQVSRAVVQQAIWRLKSDGFIYSINRQGLFVVDTPPHLNRYGLLTPALPGDPGWSRFHGALLNEARNLENRRSNCEVVLFAGLANNTTCADQVARLYDDLENHRLAGVILTPFVSQAISEARLRDLGVPYVSVNCMPENSDSAVINVDTLQLATRALQWLKERGRTRIAAIRCVDVNSNMLPEYVRQLGMDCRRYWIQPITRENPEVTKDLIPLLMDYPPEERPDGLFIADDNLVEHAAAGLIATGVQCNQDLDVVAHCNWPWAVPSVIPMKRIGFHIGDMLSRCIRAIDTMRQSQSAPSSQAIPALFEEEVDQVNLEILANQQHNDNATSF